MFKKASDKKAYTAEDIERYHRGLLSAAERNALERAALEDALLEEALEGYAILPPGQSVLDLATLKIRLDKRVSGSGRTLSVWWKVAAVAVLVAGVATLVYINRGSTAKELTVLAKTENKQPDTVPPPVTPPPLQANARPMASAKRIDREKLVAKNARRAARAVPAAMVAAPAASDSTVVVMSTGVATLVTHDTAKSIAGIMARNFKRFNFDNRVTDTNNQPIIATIQLLSGGRSVVTDQNGFFNISTPDTQARIVVSSLGYEPRQYYAYELKNVSSIQLSPSNTNLDEVVVSTLDVRKKKTAEKFPSLDDSTTAQPEIGWGGYDDYLVNNLQFPDEAVLHHIHGEVDLSFQVDPGGKPVDIRIVKSLCNPCDAEAVRLLERGPHWKNGTKGRKGKLKVHF